MKNKTIILGVGSYDKENPTCVKVIPTSWTNPNTYHVITEDGEFSKSEYLGEHTKEELMKYYSIDIDSIGDPISEILKRTPNDQDLGKKIRSIYNSIIS